VSVYNSMPYLPMAVDSILEQTYADFDFVIIDDGSTDESLEYLRSHKDRRIKLFHQSNQGLGAALNFGLQKIDTEFVARMDGDDIAVGNRLERQMERMVADPELVMLGTGIAFTLDGKKTAFPPPMPINHKDIYSILYQGGHAISHPTIMCRTNVLKNIGGYRISGVGQDWDLFLRMCEVGKAANLSDVLLHYRLHETSNAWSSSEKAIIGKQFAVESAKMRRMGQKEPSYDEFTRKCTQPNTRTQVIRKVLSFSDNAYRLAILSSLKSNYPKMVAAFFLSVLSNPKKLYLYIMKKMINLHR